MSNKWIKSGDTTNNLFGRTLGDILNSKVRVNIEDTTIIDNTGYIFSQLSGGSFRELGLFIVGDDLELIWGGVQTTIATMTAIYGEQSRVGRDIDLECDPSTLQYTLTIGSYSTSGAFGVGTARLDGTPFRLGARSDSANVTGSAGGYPLSEESKLGDTRVWINDVQVRDFVMPNNPTSNSVECLIDSANNLTVFAGDGTDFEGEDAVENPDAPVINLSPPQRVYDLTVGDTFTPPVATSSDITGNSKILEPTTDTYQDAVGNWELRYNDVDGAGNVAVEVVVVINVAAAIEGPLETIPNVLPDVASNGAITIDASNVVADGGIHEIKVRPTNPTAHNNDNTNDSKILSAGTGYIYTTIAPPVTTDTEISFLFSVTSVTGRVTESKTITQTVLAATSLPTVNTGGNITNANIGDVVQLDYTNSADNGTGIRSYYTEQIAGAYVELDDKNSPTPSFVFPDKETAGTYANDLARLEPLVLGVPMIPLGLRKELEITPKGAFRVNAGGDSNSSYALGSLGVNPANNSLLMAGPTATSTLAEFQIPETLSLETRAADIPEAVVLQDYSSILFVPREGVPDRFDALPEYATIDSLGRPRVDRITNPYVLGGNLLVTAVGYYETTNIAENMLLLDPNDLAATPRGFFEVEGRAHVAGNIFAIPEDWRSTFDNYEYGLTSSPLYAIVSRFPIGISFAGFNPLDVINADVDVEVERSIDSTIYMDYTQTNQIAPGVDNTNKIKEDIDPIFTTFSRCRHAFPIPGTDIFLGMGSSGGNHSGHIYKGMQDDGLIGGGPVPYEADDRYAYYWAYRRDDIRAAYDSGEPWNVQPFSFGKWQHPFASIGIGEVYNPVDNMLYVALGGAGKVGQYDEVPLIYGYEIKSRDENSPVVVLPDDLVFEVTVTNNEGVSSVETVTVSSNSVVAGNTITVNEPNQTIEFGGTPTPYTAIVTDGSGNIVNVDVVETGDTVNPNVAGVYTRNFDAPDAARVTRFITVLAESVETVVNIITVNEPSQVVQFEGTPTPYTSTITDSNGNAVIGSAVESGDTVDTSIAGNYNRYFDFVDAERVTRVITVLPAPDELAVDITTSGPSVVNEPVTFTANVVGQDDTITINDGTINVEIQLSQEIIITYKDGATETI